MSTRINALLLAVVTVLVVLAMSMFTVDQRQFAIVFQLGEVKRVIQEPGLYFKIPMIQNVRFLDNRILPLGDLGALFSAGAIPVIYSLIGLKVGAEFASMLASLAETEEL